MKLPVLLAVWCACLFVPAPARAADSLKVIVVDGDEAANIVAEKIAAIPVIEVRDEKDRRVAGAIVRFVIRKTVRNRLAAVFRNGQAEVRTLTDAAGQANSSAITPLEPGSFEIDVEVRYPGQTGKATIRQTNFRNLADAKAAGREPGKSTNSNANTHTAGTSGSTTAATTAAAAPVASTAATASTAAVSAGGGMSKLAVVGLVAGGAAGAGAAVVLSRQNADLPAATVGAITAAETSGLQASTVFAFSVQTTNFEAGSLSYLWEFGDGMTSTDAAPTHVYDAPGAFTVAVTVRDARQSARSELPVRVHTLGGTWFNAPHFGGTTLTLTQSGSAIAGMQNVGGRDCAVSGATQRGTGTALLTGAPCPQTSAGDLSTHVMRLRLLAPDGSTMRAEIDYENVPFTWNLVFVRRQ